MNPKRRTFLLLWISLLLASMLLMSCGRTYEYSATVLDPPRPPAAIEGTNWDGTPFRLEDLRGKVIMLFFGYTTCPDICPTTLSDMKRLKAQLGDDADEVEVLLLTVDPERDSVERLAQYVPGFDPSFYGVRLEPEQLEATKQQYGIFSEKVDGGTNATKAGYLIDHTASVLALNREGEWRLKFSFGTPVDEMLPDVQHLLQE